MTLRARLLITVGALLAVALVCTGALVVGLTRGALVQQLDDDLREAFTTEINLRDESDQADPTGRRFALLVFERNGQSLAQRHSGPSDSLPELPAGGPLDMPLNQIIELPSADGSQHYRVLARFAQLQFGSPGPGPGPLIPIIAVLGAPMAGVDRSMNVLIGALLAVGGIVLV